MNTSAQKIRLVISYDGTNYAGWQRQTTATPTIQGSLEKNLSLLYDQPITLLTAGRTDAGVHARAQNAHFLAPKDLPIDRLQRALNSLLPSDIGVREVYLAPNDFHSQRSALFKTYIYRCIVGQVPDPLKARYTFWHRQPLDLQFLNALAEQIIGEHDFASFRTRGTDVRTTTRTVFGAGWRQVDNQEVEFKISGNGFLKQMVRNLVGTQLDLLRQKAEVLQMTEILRARNRESALSTAPAQGLCLHEIAYPQELDNRCRKI